ncbi:MAG: hypothetical protein LBE57_06315 [Methanosarcinales archaeon]|jgi:HEAT repeat protein|nr:hypothetical protein [Methanosarcinales archaeon]
MMNSKNDGSVLQNKLQFIRSIQTPTNEDLSLLIHFLADPNENEMICAAIFPILRKAGKTAADMLLSVYSDQSGKFSGKEGEDCEKLQIRFSYAFSQISESSPHVFEAFAKNRIPRVRQNGMIGFAHLNDRRYDPLLFDILTTDSDLETAYEAAITLSRGGSAVLNGFETIMANDLENCSKDEYSKDGYPKENDTRQKPYMDSQTKEDSDNVNILKKSFDKKQKSLDKHVLAKVIEISGDIGNVGTLQYLTAYLNHPDERVSRIAAESIQKIHTKENSNEKSK